MDISKKEEIAGIYKFLANCFYYPEEKQISLIKGHDLKDHQKYQSLINFLEDIEKDVERMILISGYRTILSIEKRISDTQDFITDFEEVFEQIFTLEDI